MKIMAILTYRKVVSSQHLYSWIREKKISPGCNHSSLSLSSATKPAPTKGDVVICFPKMSAKDDSTVI